MTHLDRQPTTVSRESLYWFLGFGYLQVLDILTTLAFLLRGVAEANPMVRWTMLAAGHPLVGLLYVKCVALFLGYLCLRYNRRVLLSRATIAYACLIAWNLSALVLASIQGR